MLTKNQTDLTTEKASLLTQLQQIRLENDILNKDCQKLMEKRKSLEDQI